jgi:hypothetical protein
MLNLPPLSPSGDAHFDAVRAADLRRIAEWIERASVGVDAGQAIARACEREEQRRERVRKERAAK